MAKPKDDTLIKVTLNLRKGDLEKMGALFPDSYPSVAVRNLISAFVDKHFQSTPTPTVQLDQEI